MGYLENKFLWPVGLGYGTGYGVISYFGQWDWDMELGYGVKSFLPVTQHTTVRATTEISHALERIRPGPLNVHWTVLCVMCVTALSEGSSPTS